jgi:hypothetical protein
MIEVDRLFMAFRNLIKQSDTVILSILRIQQGIHDLFHPSIFNMQILCLEKLSNFFHRILRSVSRFGIDCDHRNLFPLKK